VIDKPRVNCGRLEFNRHTLNPDKFRIAGILLIFQAERDGFSDTDIKLVE